MSHLQPNEPKQHPLELEEEEGYIDMELTPRNSPPQMKLEFEFQTAPLASAGKEIAATFPADDLFYKGKLLPLLYPSRRQMLRHLTSSSPLDFTETPPGAQAYYSMPPTETLNTPSESCNVSPAESCRVSCELNSVDYFLQWSTGFTSFTGKNHIININNINSNGSNNYYHHHNHSCRKTLSWPKKLQLARQYSSLGNKLKASRAYLKSIFTKSGCSVEPQDGANSREITNEYVKFDRNAKTPTIAAITKGIDYQNGIDEENVSVHRRSFSSTIKRHSPVKCLSSSLSSGGSSSSSLPSVSIKSSEFNGFGRRCNATEIEGLIEAAIAYCKRTSEGFDTEKWNTEAGFFSFSASRNTVENEKR